MWGISSGSDASQSPNNPLRRNAEAQMIRANEATLPANSRVIYTGDMNLTAGTSEAAWSTLVAPGQGQAIDPINLGNGSWANGSTTDPTTKAAYSDATDGLTSRLDFQLNTAPTMDNHGFSYIAGSYHTFGNNGSIKVNQASTSSLNTALTGVPNRTTILADIKTASDHYTIVADYRLPAFLSASISTAGATIISGGSLAIATTVTNAAPVASSAGGDTLDYSVTGSGALTGSTSVTDGMAATTGTTTLVVTSTTPGAGTVSVASTSQEVGGTPVSQTVANVLAHAHPSFTTPSSTGSTTISFGVRARQQPRRRIGHADRELFDSQSRRCRRRNVFVGSGSGFNRGQRQHVATHNESRPLQQSRSRQLQQLHREFEHRHLRRVHRNLHAESFR